MAIDVLGNASEGLDQSRPAPSQHNKLKFHFRLASYFLNAVEQLVVKLIKALTFKIKSR